MIARLVGGGLVDKRAARLSRVMRWRVAIVMDDDMVQYAREPCSISIFRQSIVVKREVKIMCLLIAQIADVHVISNFI